MATWPNPIDLPVFEIRRRSMDATFDGTMGVPASPHRMSVPGPPEFYVNGERVTADEYERRVQQAQDALNATILPPR